MTGSSRLAAIATALVAASFASLPTPRAQTEPPDIRVLTVPRDAEECHLLLEDILGSLAYQASGGAAVVDFLQATNVEVIIPELCNSGQYQQAFDYAQPILESLRKPTQKSGPTHACSDSKVVDGWRVHASENGYAVLKELTILSQSKPGGRTSNGSLDDALNDMFKGPRRFFKRAELAVEVEYVRNERKQEVFLRLSGDSPLEGIVDVVLHGGQSGERRGQAPFVGGTSIDLTMLLANFIGVSSDPGLRISIAMAGAPLLELAASEYPPPHSAVYYGIVQQARLNDQHVAGRCH